MELEFTWVDAVMTILIFITLGFMSGKDTHDEKMAKIEEESTNE